MKYFQVHGLFLLHGFMNVLKSLISAQRLSNILLTRSLFLLFRTDIMRINSVGYSIEMSFAMLHYFRDKDEKKGKESSSVLITIYRKQNSRRSIENISNYQRNQRLDTCIIKNTEGDTIRKASGSKINSKTARKKGRKNDRK